MSSAYEIRQAQLEARHAASEAREEWIRVRGRAGIVEYVDKRACGWVKTVVLELYGREEWKDILAAVRSVAASPRTSPWKIRDECYRLAAQRRAAEHNAEMARRREEQQAAPADPEVQQIIRSALTHIRGF